MDLLWKVIAGVLVSVVLYHTIPQERKELTLVLNILVCTMIGISATKYISPIIEYLKKLQQIGNLDDASIQILLNAVGIGLVTELTSSVCKDVGNGAVGKALQLLSVCATLWLSLPLFEELIDLITNVLGLT